MSAIAAVFETNGSQIEADCIDRFTSKLAPAGPNGLCVRNMSNVALFHAYRRTYTHTAPSLRSSNVEDQVFIVANSRIDREPDSRTLQNDCPSDDEIILRSYLQWGPESAAKLDGEFSFIIWDAREQVLMCAQNAIQAKPLYFSLLGTKFFCSSSWEALSFASKINLQPNRSALAAFICNFTLSPSETLFQQIQTIPAGTYLRISQNGFNIIKYWDSSPKRTIRFRSEEECHEAFRHHFDVAVQNRLTRTPSVGVMLSGGLDSSSVLSSIENARATASSVYPAPFLIRHEYPGFPCDESEYSQSVADMWQLALHSVYPPQTTAMLNHSLRSFPTMCLPEPTCLSINLSILAASKAEVGLIMTGHGGDELLDWSGWSAADFIRHGIPNFGLEDQVLFRAPKTVSRLRHLVASSIGELLFPGLLRTFRYQLAHYRKFPAWMCQAWFVGLVRRRRKVYEIEEQVQSVPASNPHIQFSLQYFDHFSYAQLDEMAEVSGVSLTYPFLDRNFVEFVLSISDDTNLRGPSRRHLLRQAFAKRLPTKLLERTWKPDFSTYVKHCAFDAGADNAQELARAPLLAEWELVDARKFQSAIQNVSAAQTTEWMWLMRALVLEQWMRRVFGKEEHCGL